jgi:hypothetical protein
MKGACVAFAVGMAGMTGRSTLAGVDRKTEGGPALGKDVQALVDKTPFVDTHEHLWAESHRLASVAKATDVPAPDFGMLLNIYADGDLSVAGMPPVDYKKLLSHDLSPRDKWKLFAPWYARCRHTGYLLCMRESVRALYGEDDLREDNCEAISQRLRAEIRPGFYKRILRKVANIEYAQINDLNGPVMRETFEHPDLLAQDMWTIGLGSGVQLSILEHCAGGKVRTLDQAHAAIDIGFVTFGHRAIAVKDQAAYWRSLRFENVSSADAAPLFERFAKGDSLADAEMQALQDHLFRYCVAKATESKLPVKIHTGYIAGHGSMNLGQVRNHLSDLCPLFREFPDTTFVLMHISYPYQNELIALCKHYRNVHADMCWAWIINPVAATRFVKEFIMAAPACKLFTFGGDLLSVELVPGHARIARRGIARAVGELIQEGWLAESDAPDLIERIMRGNAHKVFDHARTLR